MNVFVNFFNYWVIDTLRESNCFLKFYDSKTFRWGVFLLNDIVYFYFQVI